MLSAPYDVLKRYKADYSKYEPLVVAHKTNPKMLYCTLTNTELNRIPKEVEAHVKGKRFLNRKAEMEGLKQGQRQPATAGSDDEFWVSHESPSYLRPGWGGGCCFSVTLVILGRNARYDHAHVNALAHGGMPSFLGELNWWCRVENEIPGSVLSY